LSLCVCFILPFHLIVTTQVKFLLAELEQQKINLVWPPFELAKMMTPILKSLNNMDLAY